MVSTVHSGGGERAFSKPQICHVGWGLESPGVEYLGILYSRMSTHKVSHNACNTDNTLFLFSKTVIIDLKLSLSVSEGGRFL